MKKLISSLWNGEPVLIFGSLSAAATALVAAHVIAPWIAPVTVAIAAVWARNKVSPAQ